jgi:peptidyl-prolyl cis-trans isomerase C
MTMKPLLPDVTVNGEVIAAEQIADEAQHHPAPPGKPGLAWKAAARALAVRALMLQEARRRGLAPAPQELAPGRWETDEEALIRQLLESEIQPESPTEAELRAYHAANPELFRAPSLYEAAHILFAAHPEAPDARAAARGAAEAVLAELQADPAAFTRLAQAHSACSSRANGGCLGQISAGDTVAEFEATLARLEEGSISPTPVESRYGFHIIRLDARARGAVLPFEAVQAPLRLAREKAGSVRASRDFVQRLVAAATITGIDLRPA